MTPSSLPVPLPTVIINGERFRVFDEKDDSCGYTIVRASWCFSSYWRFSISTEKWEVWDDDDGDFVDCDNIPSLLLKARTEFVTFDKFHIEFIRVV